MSDMVERVARWICESEGYDPNGRIYGSHPNPACDGLELNWTAYTVQARAAIAAMLQPTGPMASAGHAELANGGASDAWRAMIREALK